MTSPGLTSPAQAERLRIHVERVVRPTLACADRKMQWREELLALITSIHDEELARQSSPDDALRMTLQRFGDPDALREELAGQVGRVEAAVSRVDRWLHAGREESTVRHALRIGLLHLMSVGTLLLVVAPLTALLREGNLNRVPPPLLPAALAVMLAVDAFLLTWLGDRLCRRLRDDLHPWRRPALWLGSLAGSVIVSLAGVGLMVSLSLDPRDLWSTGRHWLTMTPVMVLLFVSVLLLFLREQRRLGPWQELPLD